MGLNQGRHFYRNRYGKLIQWSPVMKKLYYAVQNKGPEPKYYGFSRREDRDHWVKTHVRATAVGSPASRPAKPSPCSSRLFPVIYHNAEHNAYLIVMAEHSQAPHGYDRWQAPFPRLHDARSRYYWWAAGEPTAREIDHHTATQRFRGAITPRTRYRTPQTADEKRVLSRIKRLRAKAASIEGRLRFWPTDADAAMLARLQAEISVLEEKSGLTKP